jgi:hypothetical protein
MFKNKNINLKKSKFYKILKNPKISKTQNQVLDNAAPVLTILHFDSIHNKYAD